MAKLLKQIILFRVKLKIERRLSNGTKRIQDAFERVQNIAEEAKQRHHRKFCALIIVDVQNAFSSALWKGILEELSSGNVKRYLYNIITRYL